MLGLGKSHLLLGGLWWSPQDPQKQPVGKVGAGLDLKNTCNRHWGAGLDLKNTCNRHWIQLDFYFFLGVFLYFDNTISWKDE